MNKHVKRTKNTLKWRTYVDGSVMGIITVSSTFCSPIIIVNVRNMDKKMVEFSLFS